MSSLFPILSTVGQKMLFWGEWVKIRVKTIKNNGAVPCRKKNLTYRTAEHGPCRAACRCGAVPRAGAVPCRAAMDFNPLGLSSCGDQSQFRQEPLT